jgi:N-acetyl-anhydromuramyl-L-alanine amidase AmpD
LEERIEELSQLPPPGGPGRPPMTDLVDEVPRHAAKDPTRQLSEIRQVVIHHTVTSPNITPARLAEYQVDTLDRPGIVYHFVVAADGTIYQVNRLETVSDHAHSRKVESVGVVFPGNSTELVPTEPQLNAGAQLCAWLLGTLRLPPEAIIGISEFAGTQSPGKQWLSGQEWKGMLLDRVEEALEAGGEGQEALIAALRARIAELEAEVEALREQLGEQPEPPPAPPPGPVGVSKPPVQNLIDKLPQHDTKRYNMRSLDEITTLVVHHSAVPPSVGPQRIAEYHVDSLDWPGIGYHFLVSEDGVLYQVNPLQTISYHAVQANPIGVGICFLGNFTNRVPPAVQLCAGAHLIAWLMQELDIQLDEVVGHKEVLTTQCPGAQWLEDKKWKQMLRQEIAEVQQEAGQPVPVPGEKPIFHYMLFWSHDGEWAEQDWINARNYIGAFHPTAGVSVQDAALAEYVTIVGGPQGVSRQIEDWLRAGGSKVERVAGDDMADTKRLLDELVAEGRRFRTLDV